MKNLVLGVAKGYGRDMLEPFVASFAKNCRSAELVLFVDDISEFTRDRLQRCERVRVVDVPAQYKDILIIHARWKMCADFLEQYGANYGQAFITDTRDVIFQGDIFETFKNFQGYLGYTTEADVIGAVNEMKIFCRTMWEALKCETIWGHEQAIMNYLVHKNLLPIENLIEIDIDGEIFTMGLTDDFSVSGEKILRGGRVPAAVHQYNRHESLIGLIDEIYHDKNFQADVRFNDMRSVAEQATCLLFANKIVDAAKFFMKKFLVTADFNGCDKALIRL